MDPAARRERRAALERQLRRRRRLTLAAVLVCLVAVLAVLIARSGGGSGHRLAGTVAGAGASRRQLSGAATRVRTPRGPATARANLLLGAHRAPREHVPILMYHVIGHATPATPNPSLWVSPQEFSEQVRALAQAGFHGVDLRQVWTAWHHHGRLPSHPVVFSFDDGSYGQLAYAMPTLRRTGWPGVLNLKIGNLNDMGGPASIRRLVAAGWEIDAHTFTHPDLTTVGSAQLEREVAGSRRRLQREFGVPVSFFCYPSGRFDDAVLAAVRRAGYIGATTTQPGWAGPGEDRLRLPRVRVDGGTSGAALLRIIAAAPGARGA